MWDVNEYAAYPDEYIRLAFDLNYVGCELDHHYNDSFSHSQFDLNYVGCELERYAMPIIHLQGLI